jgi:hypothetical protein
MLSDLLLRLRGLFKGTVVDREIDEELRFHIDRQIESYKKAGLDDAEATRRARLEFGGVDQIKEDVRDACGTRWLDDLMRSARFAGFQASPRLPCSSLRLVSAPPRSCSRSSTASS